jgi:uncharacterized phage protein (TIGR02218 family)
MRTISAALEAHFGQDVTTLAVGWIITRTDGTTFGYTNLDVPYELSPGLTLQPKTDISSVQQGTSGSVDNLDLFIPFESAAMVHEDIENGLYDGAELFLFMFNYKDLSGDIMPIIRGTLGVSSVNDTGATLEFNSLADKLNTKIMEVATYECPALLGDAICKVVLAGYTVSGAVDEVTDNAQFTATGSLSATDNYYQYGVLTWATGDNAGKKIEVKKYTGSTKAIELMFPMFYDIAAGDTFSVVAGCDKLFSTCRTKFSNYKNFRGRPHIPGEDKLQMGRASAISQPSQSVTG